MCFSKKLNRPIWRKKAYLHLETCRLQGVLCEKLAQFSQGSNVLDAPASHTDGCLWRIAWVSTTQLNKPIWKK
jgi:hypothetical protein